ncbi:hypothetical protein GA0070609_3339 [Micromonospora echinaurantiaca]|uniref:Uncharacterized protein n=2 Tax=Micromonospora echinaurantiaca TaxID=47857 RepID=A0A1C5IGZ1_9ACTN|nr:hypothetical protein GA0070609_3339 [Micromonospora echinaurantiaca]
MRIRMPRPALWHVTVAGLRPVRRTLVGVLGVSLLLVAVPALADTPDTDGAAGPAEHIDLSVGIDRSAHTVTTRNGKVLRGITVVDDKDLPRVRREQARAAAQGAGTDANGVYCLASWRFIRGGATDSHWRTTAQDWRIFANGQRNADYWNQFFLPCWLSSWREHYSYMFLANSTGDIVARDGSTQMYAGISLDGAESTFNTYAKFLVCSYDGHWMFLHWPGYYSYWEPGNRVVRGDWAATTTGQHLFHLDPAVNPGGC